MVVVVVVVYVAAVAVAVLAVAVGCDLLAPRLIFVAEWYPVDQGAPSRIYSLPRLSSCDGGVHLRHANLPRSARSQGQRQMPGSFGPLSALFVLPSAHSLECRC